jgi:hypothetical protein
VEADDCRDDESVEQRDEEGIGPMWHWTRRLRRRRLNRELDDELRAHVALATADRIANGEPAVHAERRARRELGSVLRVREEVRDVGKGVVSRVSRHRCRDQIIRRDRCIFRVRRDRER